MKKFHIALGVADIAQSVADYTNRLGEKPVLVIDNEYALWRTETLNFSLRKSVEEAGKLRHIGWENEATNGFTSNKDVNGILWEYFCAVDQEKEIKNIWPDTVYNASK